MHGFNILSNYVYVIVCTYNVTNLISAMLEYSLI